MITAYESYHPCLSLVKIITIQLGSIFHTSAKQHNTGWIFPPDRAAPPPPPPRCPGSPCAVPAVVAAASDPPVCVWTPCCSHSILQPFFIHWVSALFSYFVVQGTHLLEKESDIISDWKTKQSIIPHSVSRYSRFVLELSGTSWQFGEVSEASNKVTQLRCPPPNSWTPPFYNKQWECVHQWGYLY